MNFSIKMIYTTNNNKQQSEIDRINKPLPTPQRRILSHTVTPAIARIEPRSVAATTSSDKKLFINKNIFENVKSTSFCGSCGK